MFKIRDKKIWIALAIFALASIIFHIWGVKLGLGDDYYFVTCLDNSTFRDLMILRWNYWTSRLLIETVLIYVLQLPWSVWYIMDIFTSCLITYLLAGMLTHKKEKYTWERFGLLFLLLFSYDFRDMDTAGWMTTTVVYWWALAASFIAFLPVYFHESDGKCSKWMCFICAPSLFFAVNLEQISIIFICISIYFITVSLLEKKSVFKYLWYLLGIAVLSVIVILLCPGNGGRVDNNTDYWFPGFADFNIIQKGLLGWYSLLKTLFQDINWTFFLFTFILLLAVLCKKKNIYQILISAIPFCANVVLLLFQLINKRYYIGIVHKIMHLFDFDQPIVYYQGYLPNDIRLILLIYTICCLCVIYAIFVVFDYTKKFRNIMAVLIISGITKVGMGVFPSVWASGERTSMFLNFAFIIIGACCIDYISLKALRQTFFYIIRRKDIQ